MRLCKNNLGKIAAASGLKIPANNIFDLPEKILQFGTGVLLRGLPDVIISKANDKNIFNGRIVVVKSTATGDTKAFAEQDGLYTICIRGTAGGKNVSEEQVVASVSRVLSAASEWASILQCATSPALEIIISNTTEVGLALIEDDIFHQPPQSFPGKLVAFLYRRYQYFKGAADKGLVIIPTELLPGNGEILLATVLQLCVQNNLESAFTAWLQNANHFCSSLVDRIVPGKLPAAEQQQVTAKLQYMDELMIMSEPYCRWAIATASEKVKKILAFATAESGVIIAPGINKFRELKLRLLNSPHTFCCGLAHLAGFTTVKEAMQNNLCQQYLRRLMYEEIIPVITSGEISRQEAETFAGTVLDRFSNYFIAHQWLSISLQYSSKMATRNIALIMQYIARFNQVPDNMALGMAAHILFMKGSLQPNGSYCGTSNGKMYVISDDNAALYAAAWEAGDINMVVDKILSSEKIWQTNVALPHNFKKAVTGWLKVLLTDGALPALAMARK